MIYLLILLALLSAYREVKVLIDRGSWKKEDYRNIFWDIDWRSKFKDFDSHHASYGLFILVMLFALDITWYLIPVYWLGFFKIRNIAMHIVLKKKPMWNYLYKL